MCIRDRAKDRQQRFASALEFATALRQARTASLEATALSSGRSRLLRPATPTPAPAAINPDVLVGQLVALVRDCLADRTTDARLKQLTEGLNAWFAAVAENQTVDRQSMQLSLIHI